MSMRLYLVYGAMAPLLCSFCANAASSSLSLTISGYIAPTSFFASLPKSKPLATVDYSFGKSLQDVSKEGGKDQNKSVKNIDSSEVTVKLASFVDHVGSVLVSTPSDCRIGDASLTSQQISYIADQAYEDGSAIDPRVFTKDQGQKTKIRFSNVDARGSDLVVCQHPGALVYSY